MWLGLQYWITYACIPSHICKRPSLTIIMPPPFLSNSLSLSFISLHHSSSPRFSSLYIQLSSMWQQAMPPSSKTTLGFLLRLFLGSLVVASVFVSEYEAEPRTYKRLTASNIQWMTPGCKFDMEIRQAGHLGMCSADSIRMKVDGKIALLLDEKPWSVAGLSDLNDRRKL